jgi:hypothetical protein
VAAGLGDGLTLPGPASLISSKELTRAQDVNGIVVVIDGRSIMSLGTILLIILILILIGALPTWPYSSGWGYYPSGGIGLILVIVIILLLLGRI